MMSKYLYFSRKKMAKVAVVTGSNKGIYFKTYN